MLLLVGVVGAGYALLRTSLPRLSGAIPVVGLSAPVQIERDADGVPTLTAASEIDLVRAVGFVHAQERFFQMDLLRRAGTGELSALLGPAVLDADRSLRIHRLRARAQSMVTGLSSADRALLDAYSAGVRAGLEDLGSAPFEYVLLGVEPEPWRPEDVLCVAFAMFFTLQDSTGSAELRRMAIERALPAPMAALVLSPGTTWDAAIDDSTFELPDLPSVTTSSRPASASPEPPVPPSPGSNNWAVSGRRSVHGGAMVADDMHLGLRMPNIWYRARQRLTGDPALDVTGVTLPGTPIVVAGSNGHIAWGFTNAYIDTSDLVVIEAGPEPDTYQTPDGPKAFEILRETIEVRGADPVTLDVRQTVWGPVVAQDFEGRPLALRWTVYDPGANDLGLRDMAFARTLEDAVSAAQGAGMPNQNVMIAAADGRIAWTVSGLIPVRPEGCEGARPSSWAEGGCAWLRYAEPSEVPTVIDPEDGRLWTANNRVVGAGQRGAARYQDPALGARAQQIRDGLRAQDKFSEADLLAIQLDDRAVFLERWRSLMLTRLDGETHAGMRGAVEQWGDRAAPESVGYALVDAFREAVFDRVAAPILAPARQLVENTPELRLRRLRPRSSEHFVWTILEARPKALLPGDYSSWDAVLDAAVEDVQAVVDEEAEGDLDRFTWGERNRLAIRHPLSSAVPLLGRLVDPPSAPMPGDRYMPRVQSPRHGASERFVVSPGKEAQGIFHMPAGQASHPLSPYLHAGHEAWVNGEPTPFLPGPTRWTLTLDPAPSP